MLYHGKGLSTTHDGEDPFNSRKGLNLCRRATAVLKDIDAVAPCAVDGPRFNRMTQCVRAHINCQTTIEIKGVHKKLSVIE